MKNQPSPPNADTALRRRAELRLRKAQRRPKSKSGGQKSAVEPQRLLHELQVHQVELELQNAELQETQDRMEALLDNYTSLYDFAPVGYFSLDEQSRILEVNLTGATLLGVERSRLLQRRLTSFAVPASLAGLRGFLEQVFATPEKQACEISLRQEDGTVFWANFHAVAASSGSAARKWCRVAVSDITAFKGAEQAQHRLEALTESNRELEREVARRHAVEQSLRKTEQHQRQLLELSRLHQEQLRRLSRQVIQDQEDERKRISRELHDVIAQVLTGINVQLATLQAEATVNPRAFARNIARTQRLVEKSVDIVHQFARELRPAVLDDLGLVPALHSHLKDFAKQAGIRVHMNAFTTGPIDKLDTAGRTTLYRVAQEALTNVARHAQASRVEVSLLKTPAGLRLCIQDDGKSFVVEQALNPKKNQRLGLLGMRERVEMIGGQFTVSSVPGQGTLVQAEIPLGAGKRGGGGRKTHP